MVLCFTGAAWSLDNPTVGPEHAKLRALHQSQTYDSDREDMLVKALTKHEIVEGSLCLQAQDLSWAALVETKYT